MLRSTLCACFLAVLSACSVGEAAMDNDRSSELIIIDHSAYPYGSVYWQ